MVLPIQLFVDSIGGALVKVEGACVCMGGGGMSAREGRDARIGMHSQRCAALKWIAAAASALGGELECEGEREESWEGGVGALILCCCIGRAAFK